MIYVIFTNYGIEKNNGFVTNYEFAKEKNDGYLIKIYKIIMNYGFEKKYWVSDESWICKEKK